MNIVDFIVERSAYFEKIVEKHSKATLERGRQQADPETFSFNSHFVRFLLDKNQELLEKRAQEAMNKTIQYFGKTIQLYAPLYVSDHCSSNCKYCGYGANKKFRRKTLSLNEVLQEAQVLQESGIRHVLLLSGDSRKFCPPEFLLAIVCKLKPMFASVSLEVYPMTVNEYAMFARAGVDGVTVYQEVYDKPLYAHYHEAGKKADYQFRITTPERILQAGIPHVNMGVLLGLAKPEKEIFLLASHVNYLLKQYPEAEFSISFPRLKNVPDDFSIPFRVSDPMLVRFIIALRLAFPRVGLVLSTRESQFFRNKVFRIGITRMSAGSSTQVGGYALTNSQTPQFLTEDQRNVKEIINFIRQQGYQAVMKDWEINI